jgi:hypothetical protein
MLDRSTEIARDDAWAPQYRLVDAVPAPVDRREVLRYLGYPARAAPPWLDPLLDRWIGEAKRRSQPRAAYAVFPIVAMGPRHLALQGPLGTVEFAGAIGEFLGVSRQVAAFVATAGSGPEQLASQLLHDHQPLPALIVNAVGSERAEAAEAVVLEQLRTVTPTTRLAPTLPYSPGYCGMALAEQSKLFSLFADQPIGVSLTADWLMNPLKSVSGLIGLGSPDEVQYHGSPCDRCDIQRCAMRR